MPDPTDDVELPQATVVRPKRSRISIVWIIPVLAVLVGIGIAVQRIRAEGPTITIVFRAAEGIEAGKTFIKYRDVIIGQVNTVQFTEDYQNVEVTAKISKRAAGLMVEDAQFWVVRPTISLSGDLGPQHAAVGQLHRLPGRDVDGRGHGFHRAREGAVRSRPARARVHAEGGRPGLARGGLTGPLPPPSGGPGRQLRTHAGRQVGRDPGVRQHAVRQLREPGHAVLAGERHRRHRRFERPGHPHGVARIAARGRALVRRAAVHPRHDRRSARLGLPPLRRPRHRDEGARRDHAPVRASLQRVAARPRRRRARDLPRRPDRRGRRHRLRLRGGEAEHRPARDDHVLSRAPPRVLGREPAGQGRADAQGRRPAAQRVPAAPGRRSWPARTAEDR
ncbi:MAG: MCE family protein [Betaproteobacteria bacterium]|nr:MCE family protein [Betaproteobacteria bacterium]